jgi:hypothetical protein
MLLQTGSYRFGRSSNSLMLDAGTTNDPQFGLTISPQGLVTVYPSPSGLIVDGQVITEATPLQINQVIAVGSDRFMLCPSDRLGVTRTSGSADGSRPMPQKAKGKRSTRPSSIGSRGNGTTPSELAGMVSSVPLRFTVG